MLCSDASTCLEQAAEMTWVRRRSARPQRHASHRPEHDQPHLGDRRALHPGYAISQQKRKRTEETIRLGQDDRWARPADAARRRAFTVQVHPDYGSLRPHPAAQIARGGRMSGRTMNESRPIRRPAWLNQ
jgi:hypothetical protein